MLVSDFDYDLPPELIAQEPAEPRDHSRLMRLRRATGTVSHHRFDALPQLLRPGDLLVFNDTRVLRARLRGYKVPGPITDATAATEATRRGARVEALLLREVDTNLWEALLKPSARLRPGTTLCFVSRDGAVEARAQPVERTAHGWLVRFFGADVRAALPRLGEVPLPPYIAAQLRDEERYQTIFAQGSANPLAATYGSAEANMTQAASRLESAAAPTAGLHFTPATLDALRERGIATAFVTLQIGIGTFRPMQSDMVEAHAMHEEAFDIPAQTARLICEQKQRGGRVVAVGTTTTRVLEAAANSSTGVKAGVSRTSIFIRPGHHFQIVDALLTNFHLSRSTLLVMIAAFAQDAASDKIAQGEDDEDSEGARRDSVESGDADAARLSGLQKIRYAYSQAIRERYRFFSFGDAMLIE